jgi:hypothetical protein
MEQTKKSKPGIKLHPNQLPLYRVVLIYRTGNRMTTLKEDLMLNEAERFIEAYPRSSNYRLVRQYQNRQTIKGKR